MMLVADNLQFTRRGLAEALQRQDPLPLQAMVRGLEAAGSGTRQEALFR